MLENKKFGTPFPGDNSTSSRELTAATQSFPRQTPRSLVASRNVLRSCQRCNRLWIQNDLHAVSFEETNLSCAITNQRQSCSASSSLLIGLIFSREYHLFIKVLHIYTSNIVWTSLWFLHPFWIFTSSSLVTNKLSCRGRACEKSCSLRGVQDDQGGCSLHWSKCGTLASVKVFMATHWLGLGQTGSIFWNENQRTVFFFWGMEVCWDFKSPFTMQTTENWKRGLPSFAANKLSMRTESINELSQWKRRKRWSQCRSFSKHFGGDCRISYSISEVKGAVTSTRRLMKIAGLGLFIVIFVFVARRFRGTCRLFLGTSGSGSTLGEWGKIPVEVGIFFLLPQSLERTYREG